MPTNSVVEMPIRTRRDWVAKGNRSAESLTGPDPALLIGCRRDAACAWARMNSLRERLRKCTSFANLCLKQTVHRWFSVARATAKNRTIDTRFTLSRGAQPSRSARKACSRSSGVSPRRRGVGLFRRGGYKGRRSGQRAGGLKRPVR